MTTNPTGTWEPFRALEDVQARLDRLMRRWQPSVGPEAVASDRPAIDMRQVGEDVVVRVDMPGVKADDVTVEIAKGVLTVAGRRGEEHEEETAEGWLVRERASGTLTRSLTLPTGADEEHATATFADGVLEVTIPVPTVPATPETRRVPVEAKQPGLTPAD
jgi:HSP20 family protein